MIEVGEYVRTNEGYIGILKEIDKKEYNFLKIDVQKERIKNVFYFLNYMYLKEENIKKHSKNIIDLIEVGDYVNGNKVYKITSTCIYCVGKAVQNKLTINIETILTKEKYEANCYKKEG